MTFQELGLQKQLFNSINELGFENLTPIQEKSYSIVKSGKNIVGVSQTGTGKTLAYLLPILNDLKYSTQINPRVLVMVPTRELVVQVEEQCELYSKYVSVRTLGVYGGTNINTQWKQAMEGVDILVATPGRLYDMALNGLIELKGIKKMVIDEVDVMLDLGFRLQLNNLFEILPEKRQNIMFSATMTTEVKELIDDYFIKPQHISIALSGTPLKNINQTCYAVENFYTKKNLLAHLLKDKQTFAKVLVFTASKKMADRLFESLEEVYGKEMGIIHSNKSQNYRLKAVEEFDSGKNRILIATDVIARGLDLPEITHVVNIDVPKFPENYMHRIGRTGRAKAKGHSILMYRAEEENDKIAIEVLMNQNIDELVFPSEVEISAQKTPEERIEKGKDPNPARNRKTKQKFDGGGAFHEKKAKNKKTNKGGKYRRELAVKYKKPRTRGDKNQNRKKK